MPLLSISACAGCDGPRGTVRPPSSASVRPAIPAIPAMPALVAPPQPAVLAPPPRSAPPCPPEMARVGASCVDRFEAHLVTRQSDGTVVRHAYDERPTAGVVYEARSEAGVFPQAYMSRDESDAACRAAGKRLCSLREWERACRGDAHRTYPYGDVWQAGRCNEGKPHLVTLRFGADPRRWRYEDFNDPTLDREPGFLARSGEATSCVTPEGAFDLAGNLHEWVSDAVDAALLARMEGEGLRRQWQPAHRGNGVFVGGFFSSRSEHGPGCRFITVAHEPGYHDYSTGFRCCIDASDATDG